MKSLLADFDILMNVGGFQNVEQIDRSVIGEFSAFIPFQLSSLTASVYQSLKGVHMEANNECRIISKELCDDCGEV